jgi:hypothetical protein
VLKPLKKQSPGVKKQNNHVSQMMTWKNFDFTDALI